MLNFWFLSGVTAMEKKKYFGLMIDCSRLAVWTVPAVKRLIDLMHKMGYNMLMLYTEDTYEVDNQPLFGYLRGRYTKDELKEIVAYGEANGVELIPCIQTLGHLEMIFRWNCYKQINDCEGILLTEDERTYSLLEDMFKTVRECFKSQWIHIGMDEAHSLGKGKYRDIHGEQDRFGILSRHLKKVTELAEKYDFKPMMWSDMFFRLANGGEYYVSDPEVITPEVTATAPENVDLVYWDYYGRNRAHYDVNMVAHKKFNNSLWFAGGIWTWTGLAPHNRVSLEVVKASLDSCRANGVENVFFTMWGDNGAECSVFSALPAIFYASEAYKGNTDRVDIANKFKEMIGIDFDDFMKLEYPTYANDEYANHCWQPDRPLTFNDVFKGIFDNVIEAQCPDTKARYTQYAKELRELENAPEYGYLFKYAAVHCEFLAVKSDLGIRVRKAYEAGDRQALRECVRDLGYCEEKCEELYFAFRDAWLQDRKGAGLEQHDIRFGGLKFRLRDCRLRLEDYLEGKIGTVDDLDEKLIEVYNKLEGYRQCLWPDIATVSL